MPKISDIANLMEKKVDLTEFFGEDAFITLKKLNKYQFSLLLNRARQGYSTLLYSKMAEYDEIDEDKFIEARNSIPTEEAQERLIVESEISREYFLYSIKKDQHNFYGEDGKLVDLDGGWFFDQYSGLLNKEGLSLSDSLVNKIISFNRKGLELGEQTGQR